MPQRTLYPETSIGMCFIRVSIPVTMRTSVRGIRKTCLGTHSPQREATWAHLTHDRVFLYLEHDSAGLLSSCASAACPFGHLQQFVSATHCPLVYTNVASIGRLNIETQNRHRCVPLSSCAAGMQLEPIVI